MHKSSAHDHFLRPDTNNRVIPASLILGYLSIIVYGSLIPFAWNGLTFDAAWIKFQHIPLLKLGVINRADLVANLLLYIPLGFLTCGLVAGQSRNPLILTTSAVLSTLFAAVVALGVEFTQLFFTPPRTVSLNDIYAEFAGGLLGAVLWPATGMRFRHMVRTILHGGKNAHHAFLAAYALAYLALNLFPYDFLLSYDEWQRKMGSGHVGWLFAPQCGSNCVWKLIPEALAVAPLAILFFQSPQRASLISAAAAGAILGIFIEALQLAIASGISQGASIGSRAAGIMLGVSLARRLPKIDWRRLRQYVHGLLILGLIPYLVLLARVNHWFSGDWSGLPEGIARLEQIHFLPFYYHYYTSEITALISLLFQAGIYAPVGIGFWLWHRAGSLINPTHPGALWPCLTAGVLACVIEAGKLFVPGTHPDPTNILIAIASASVTYRLFDLLLATRLEAHQGIDNRTAAKTACHNRETNLMDADQAVYQANEQSKVTAWHDQQTSPPISSPALTRQVESSTLVKEHPQHSQHSRQPLWSVITGTIALSLAGIAALTSPFGMQWILLPFFIYIILLWWRPDLWLIWILASLPLLDLTPWSGRLYWTEYDTLLLATAGVGYLRLRPDRYMQPVLRRPAIVLLTLFVFSTAISLGIGIFPLAPLDHNAFANYYSSYNGLRAVKGLLFALIFIPLLAREWHKAEQAVRRLALGMSLGLAVEILYILWERITFPGLFNFETGYRITGSFHGMHTGGAYIEGFLVLALPFTALWAWQQRRATITVLAIGLYCLGAYCVMVTFSRGGQVAFVLVTIMLTAGLLRLALHERARLLSNLYIVILVTGIAGVIAWPIFSSSYSQARFAIIDRDTVTRMDHWQNTIDIASMQGASIFGMGLGSFPSAFFWYSNTPVRPSTYTFATEGQNIFLQLGNGGALYFEQPVAVKLKQHYILTMNLRSQAPTAAITAPVCEKALLYSFDCIWSTIRLDNAPPGQWGYYEVEIFTDKFNQANSRIRRPVKLSLYNHQRGTMVEVDNISLIDSNGNNLIRNGDFSDGMSHWFFSTDNQLPWNIENLYLHIFFEQGWLGLACFLAITGYMLLRGLVRTWHNDSLSMTLCVSLGAFLVLGMINSLIDEPRLAFLFYLLLSTGLITDTRASPQHSASLSRNTP